MEYDAYRIVIGEPVQSNTCTELRNDTKRWQCGEFIVSLKRPLQLFLCSPDPKVVQDDIPLENI